ncbi:prepilin peptidase [Actinomycetota bacterium]
MQPLLVLVLAALGTSGGWAARSWLRAGRHLRAGETTRAPRGWRWVTPASALAGLLMGVPHLSSPVLALGYAAAAPVLVTLAAVDLDVRRLPDRLTALLAALAVGLATAFALAGPDWAAWRRALLAGALLGVAYLLLALVGGGGGLGLGDVKLAPGLGVLTGLLGWPAVVTATFVAFLSGSAHAAYLLARGHGRKATLPFGPHLVLGTVVAVALG